MLKFDALLVAGEAEGEPTLLRYGVRIPLVEVEGTLARNWEGHNDAPRGRLAPAAAPPST